MINNDKIVWKLDVRMMGGGGGCNCVCVTEEKVSS